MSWNGSDQSTPTPRKRATPPRRTSSTSSTSSPSSTSSTPRSLLRGALAGLIVVALAAAALWYFVLRAPAPRPSTSTSPSTSSHRIAETKPAPAPTNAAPAKKTAKPPLSSVEAEKERIRKILEAHGWTNGVYHSPHDPEYAKNHAAFLERQKRERPFTYDCENDISALVNSKPGGFIFPLSLDDDFVEDFKRSLVTPIIISKDDSDELKEMKQAVIDAKIYLKERMDAGEDICQVLEDTRREMNLVTDIHDDFRKGMFDLYRKGASEAEIDDYITAANKLLDKRGGEKIFLPPHFKARFSK